MQAPEFAGVIPVAVFATFRPMLLPKYQRFVAWRYLLERNRVLSGSVAAVVQACFWIGMGMGAACLWFPLSDITKVPPPNPPVLLIQWIGIAVVLPLAALVAGLVERSRGRSALAWLLCSAHWGLLSLAVFAFYRRGVMQEGWKQTEIFVALALYLVVAVGSPIMAGVLASWRRGKSPSGAGFGLALVLCLPAFLPWILTKLRPRWVRAGKAIAFLFSLQCVLLEFLLIYAAFVGIKRFAWPVLFAGESVSSVAVAIMAALTIGLCALALAVLAFLQRRVWRAPLEFGAFALSVAIVNVVLALFFHGVHEVGENLKFVGGWGDYTPPMGLIMPAIVAAAIAILALVLLGVRYLFTFFTTVSIGGVTIGTMALVIVLSVMSGFESDLREKILGFNAHIQISKTDELQFSDYRKVETMLEGLDAVVGYTPFLITEAYMSNHNNYGNVTLKGIDPARVAGVTEIVHNLEKGDERALEKIWPLGEDGSILGAPGLPTYNDNDDDEGPIDFSGGLDELSDEDLEEPALDLGPPTDLSGGLETYQEPDAGLVANQGEAAPATPGLGEAMELPMPGQELEPLEDWDVEILPHDYIMAETAILDGVLVGRELANQIHLATDQEVRVISPLPDVSPDGLTIPRMKNFRIAGRFFSGMYEYDLKYVYCSLSALQNFLDLGDEVNGIEVRVRDPRSTGAIVKQIEEALGPSYRVQDWKELNKALFSALKLEKIAMFFVLVIIVLVASFSIIGNLIMVVIEKAKEIAILKTLGSSDGGVMKIFITQGFFIGLVGTSLGVALGLGACYLGKTFGVPLDPDVYYIDKLPIQVELGSVAVVALAGLVISVVATLYPAFLAARMQPVKGLRWNS